jgi:hypothetical protein
VSNESFSVTSKETSVEKREKIEMRKSYRNLAAKLCIVLLVASADSMLAQGSPDIVWQGANTGYVKYTHLASRRNSPVTLSQQPRTEYGTIL